MGSCVEARRVDILPALMEAYESICLVSFERVLRFREVEHGGWPSPSSVVLVARY